MLCHPNREEKSGKGWSFNGKVPFLKFILMKVVGVLLGL